jgi:hypothetical protein
MLVDSGGKGCSPANTKSCTGGGARPPASGCEEHAGGGAFGAREPTTDSFSCSENRL